MTMTRGAICLGSDLNGRIKLKYQRIGDWARSAVYRISLNRMQLSEDPRGVVAVGWW